MSRLLPLSSLYYTYLIKKKSFIFCTLILIVLGLFLIPGKDADYVTFYMGNISPAPNKFWIGNVSAIFSNVIISWLLIHILAGEREKEILNYTYVQEDLSFLSSFFKALYKILGLFFIGMTFLFILNITIFIQNIELTGPYFIFPLLYFSVPYILIVAGLSYFIEYYIKNNFLKYAVYYILVFFIMFNDRFFLGILGIHELNFIINKNISETNVFAIGYLPKSRLHIISLQEPILPLFWLNKLGALVLFVPTVYLLSKIPINRKLITIKMFTDFSQKGSEMKSIKFSFSQIKKDLSFFNILQKDFYLFSRSIDKTAIYAILIIWILLFPVKEDFLKFLLPLLFFFTLFINKFLTRLSLYNIDYAEKISPYKNFEIVLSKNVIIFAFYVILLIPLLIKHSFTQNMYVLLSFLILTGFQVFMSRVFKNNTFIDILLIILFATYLTGKPILNIFQL
ncbi:hypothetical protein [Chryseobacterium sp. GVT01B]|uniref:hypothetical protein n=1 Tax=Chryseobacterium sp. GVT01B TaxID=2862675 RepID=UPI001CBDAF4A|nr:hypothetical protein [Chryseobacterium sp. GVT01B]